MIAETTLDGIVTHERLVTHDANSFAARCQRVPVSRLRSCSWLLMLEVKCTKRTGSCGADWMDKRKASDLGSITQVRRITVMVPPCLNSHCEELWLRDTTAYFRSHRI